MVHVGTVRSPSLFHTLPLGHYCITVLCMALKQDLD